MVVAARTRIRALSSLQEVAEEGGEVKLLAWKPPWVEIHQKVSWEIATRYWDAKAR